MSSPAIYLFAKKPAPGEVKTRLLDTFTAQQAADIATGLLRASVERVCAAWSGQVIVSVWPDDDHSSFTWIKQNHDITFTRQIPGNLGQKMLAVLREGVAMHGAAAVFGCDIPHLDPIILHKVFESLHDGHNVIGPTDDGGFYLIGLTQVEENMFNDIEWGTESVFERTLSNLRDCGVPKPEILPPQRDIDTAQDVEWAVQSFSWLRAYLPVL